MSRTPATAHRARIIAATARLDRKPVARRGRGGFRHVTKQPTRGQALARQRQIQAWTKGQQKKGTK